MKKKPLWIDFIKWTVEICHSRAGLEFLQESILSKILQQVCKNLSRFLHTFHTQLKWRTILSFS